MTRPVGLERPHLRLVADPGRDSQCAWFERAQRCSKQFLLRHGNTLSDPSLADWVVEQCAELAWETREGAPQWSSLRVRELWLRLGNLHRFFPQPRLVVAFYDTLRVFLPWLVARGELSRESCLRMLEELEFVRSPMLERAREQLALRQRDRSRYRTL